MKRWYDDVFVKKEGGSNVFHDGAFQLDIYTGELDTEVCRVLDCLRYARDFKGVQF